MKAIKTQQRFRCDFCKHTGTKSSMIIHEKRCYRNPNRFCDYCDNTGKVEVETLEDGSGYSKSIMGDCPYCSKFNPKMLEEIKTREAKGNF